MIKKKKSEIVFVVIISIILLAATPVTIHSVNNYNQRKRLLNPQPLTLQQIQNADIYNASKLMIVAHPDDELLWGGGHLMEGDYLVVCVTRGYDKERSKEFCDAVTASGNEPLILPYPDKIGRKRNNWDELHDKIEQDLSLVMTYKNWDSIVTHNKRGEYGHIHHKMVHKMVTHIFDKGDRNFENTHLYFFGKYYRRVDLPGAESQLVPMTDQQIKFKNELTVYYKSQEKVIKNLWHMAPYEMWTEHGNHNSNEMPENQDKIMEAANEA
ncbi:MAG: PIG-L family deacetylase [Oscillospiraceae bacterium]